MKQVVFNIGYEYHGNSGILSNYPIVWDCDFKTFAKKIRQKGNIKSLFEWAKANHVTPSSISIALGIYDGNEYFNYTVKMINVREYRKHWESVYKKEWKH